ncbi:hypothetical protein A7P96_05225 [Eikenella sp. NML03-A-027]|nr:hypothetical protein [Eikenella sp. NML03-A-027]OAM31438.1 hypothetical protein A7P96_05225 [Eikenella sp. NML03-A-027]
MVINLLQFLAPFHQHFQLLTPLVQLIQHGFLLLNHSVIVQRPMLLTLIAVPAQSNQIHDVVIATIADRINMVYFQHHIRCSCHNTDK